MEEGTLLAKSDIKKVTLSDGIERYYIDSYPKLYWIINERFKEQRDNNPDAEPIIDLSRLVICIQNGLRTISLRTEQLCGKIEGIINLGKANDLIPKKRGEIVIKNEIQFEDCVSFHRSKRSNITEIKIFAKMPIVFSFDLNRLKLRIQD